MLEIGNVKKLMQTRFGPSDSEDVKERENSYSTVIACFLGFDDPEDCYQLEEHYSNIADESNIAWILAFSKWMQDKGYDWGAMEGHQDNGTRYIVYGISYRDDSHACIYRDGELWHDPHPDGTGLERELFYEFIEPTILKLQ